MFSGMAHIVLNILVFTASINVVCGNVNIISGVKIQYMEKDIHKIGKLKTKVNFVWPKIAKNQNKSEVCPLSNTASFPMLWILVPKTVSPQCDKMMPLFPSSEWLLIWSGEEIETHFWCCTGPLFALTWTRVALCMAQHQTLIYDNWTASITRDWDWLWEHSAPAHCPAGTQRPTKLR